MKLSDHPPPAHSRSRQQPPWDRPPAAVWPRQGYPRRRDWTRLQWPALVLLLLLLGRVPGGLGQGELGIDFSPGLVPVADGIYVYEGHLRLAGEKEILRVNSLVVLTPEGVLVADGQPTPRDGKALLGAIRKLTPQPVRFLVNSSPHSDHSGSNSAFRDAVIISHSNAFESIRNLSGSHPPDLTFSDQMTLHLGGRKVELHYYGVGHTEGDTVVYLPRERVAFLSELYFNGVAASLHEGHAREHIATLSRSMKLDADWFLPGHGRVTGETPAGLRAGLSRYQDNIRAIHEGVSKHLERGDSLPATLAAIDRSLSPFSSLPFYSYFKERTISAVYRALAAER